MILVVGTFTLGLAVIAAIAAFIARETSRIHMNDLGKKDAVPVPEGRVRADADRGKGTCVEIALAAVSVLADADRELP